MCLTEGESTLKLKVKIGDSHSAVPSSAALPKKAEDGKSTGGAYGKIKDEQAMRFKFPNYFVDVKN